MAEADIAFVAAAGATGLAVAVSVWAWRFRLHAARRLQLAAARADAAEARLADIDAAAASFDDVVLAIEHGEARVTAGAGALPLALKALGRPEDGDAEALIDALAATRPEVAERLTRLIEAGEPTSFLTPATGGALRVEGRAGGGAVWLRLRPGSEMRPEGRLDGVIEALPTPAWIVDASGQLVWANAAWLEAAQAADVEQARARGRTFDRGADAILREAARLGRRHEGFRWTTTAGRRRAWRVIAQPLGDGEVIAFAQDMTEAEETRDTLRRHVEAHDETLNHLADAVAIFGASKRLTFYNTAFQTLFELDAAWLDERPTHAELLDRLRQRRRLPETADYAGWKARELEFYGASSAAPDDSWRLPDGRTLRVVRQPHPLGGILLLFSDITGELELRTRYNAQIQVQTATLDKLNDAVAVFGSDGVLRLHNEAFEKFWGLSGETIRAASSFDALADLCREKLPDKALWLELKARVADPDPESRIAVSGEAPTTDHRVAAWQTRPLPDGATLVAFSDVTARRELERALVQREAALEESRALKREFVGNVSYELRTPLTTIVGYAELMEQQASDLSERSRQHAGAIRIAASQLARSIDDVLDMAQIDAGEMALSLGDVRIRELFAAAEERIRPKVEGRGAALVVECPEDIGAIRADEQRVTQALNHLLDHAVRATPEGGEVRLRAERGRSELRIHVSDTGRGIPYHLQAHVFDRFVRRERGGPGLGLALVKSLAELHGGWASVESEPGKGATFTLHLPERASSSAVPPELELGEVG